MKYRVHLSLGSNLDREKNYPAAVALIGALGRIEAVSTVYETEPVGMDPETPPFFNGAVVLATSLEPAELKQRLRDEVETALGRDRPAGTRWVPRTIDVDIALCGASVGDIAGRRVPDPDILRFLHVAVPLAEVSGDLVHPEDGRTLAEIAASLEGTGPLPVPRPDIILEY
jgi:2-amino-4-hydroxy-6-hydroxymethyldihydropteridine diphosphokinase